MSDLSSIIKVTIVIPLYQVQDYIKSCLLSVVNQTYIGPIECIIVDDCGTDSSCQIVEDFIQEYNGEISFKLIRHSKNRGLSAARNTGIGCASGDYIYFLDSDDEITVDCIHKLTSPLNKYRYDFVTADFVNVGGRPVTTHLIAEGEYKSTIKEAYYNKEWNVTAWNKLCNLDFLRRNNIVFKEGIIHEDILWTFFLANLANSMYAIQEKTYIYNNRDVSIMGSMTLLQSKDSKLVIYSEINSYLFNRGLNDRCDVSYIWRIKYEMFNEIRCWDYKKSKKYILALKQNTKVNPIWAWNLNLLPFKNLIKYLYLILPDSIACIYYRMLNNCSKVLSSLRLE